MVGDEIRTGGGPAELTAAELAPAELVPAERVSAELAPAELAAGLRAGYDAAAGEWADGPGLMYAQLARVLVAAAPVPLAGRLVLDLGAGAGVAGRAALAAGARHVVGADLSEGMLRHSGDALPAAGYPVAADAVALPFRDASFDLVVAAFCLNHLSSLAAGLAEARRVGGAIAASLFAPGWTHPAKDAVDAALRPFGYREPAWHACLSLDADRLAGRAEAAGFSQLRVRTVTVPAGLVTPAELAAWRLGLAQFAPFLHSLDAPARTAARRAAERAVAQAAGQAGAGPAPLAVSMALVTAC